MYPFYINRNYLYILILDWVDLDWVIFLFPYFRSLCFSIKNGANHLYPHHYQIQPRNFLREKTLKSLRNYSNDFKKISWSSMSKFDSAKIFYSKSFKCEKFINEYPYIFFTGYKNYFHDLIQYRKQIQNL